MRLFDVNYSYTAVTVRLEKKKMLLDLNRLGFRYIHIVERAQISIEKIPHTMTVLCVKVSASENMNARSDFIQFIKIINQSFFMNTVKDPYSK